MFACCIVAVSSLFVTVVRLSVAAVWSSHGGILVDVLVAYWLLFVGYRKRLQYTRYMMMVP